MIDRRRATPLPTGTVSRRRVLLAGAVGAGTLLIRPSRASATVGERVHRDVRGLMRAACLPGLSAAIVRGGDVVWTDAWGLANIERGRRVTPDTLFMLASVSKTVVATAVLQAIQDGLFELDTHVNRVLPFAVRNPVHPDEPITVRQLLTHTSSIRDNWTLLIESYVSGDAEMALGTFLRRYLSPTGADLTPNNYYAFGPGRSYRYANVGVALAAYLVEATSGIGFDTWCERRIFAPLGMDRAGWHLEGLPRKEIAMPYGWSGAKRVRPLRALRLSRLPRRGAADDGAPSRAASRDGDGERLLARAAAALRGDRPRAAARSGPRARARPGPDLVGVPAGRADPPRARRWRRRAATVCFFDPADDVGVVALANGGWRTIQGDWSLYLIMDRLFRAAPRLG